MRWYRIAAAQGNPTAQHALATAYAAGAGVKQDYAEAARLYRQAAEQGFAPAQTALAGMYLRGEGVAKNREEAERWMRRAAGEAPATPAHPPAPVAR